MSNNNDLYSNQWQALDPEQIIQQAIARLADDAGAVLTDEVIQAFKILYQENPASYNRFRQVVKESKKVTMQLFDKLTTQKPNQDQEQNTNDIFPLIEIWDSPINGEQLLNEIKDTLQQYVIADHETIVACTLWASYTWFIDYVNYAPIANITAPEKRCGKTKLLSTLKRLSYKGFITSNISSASLFRLLELYKPTLFIDEVDTFLSLHDDMRGIINSGFTRESAFIIRCVGEDLIPTPFNVWGAKALCGIGKIADTLQDRSITLKLRRKTQGETVKNIDKSDPELWRVLRAKLARFAQDNQLKIINIQIEPLPQLNDRANDCWESLRQIATLAGGHWQQTAINSAIRINGEQEENDSTRTELLRDIQTLFNTKGIDRIFSHDLVNELNSDNEANWCTWNKGRGINARNLAKILKEFDIVSNTIRIGIDERARGYTKDQFKDAFNRYITNTPIDIPDKCVTTGQAKGDNENSQNIKRDISQMSRIEKPLQVNNNKDCHVVTDKIPPTTGRDSEKDLTDLQNDSSTHSINELMDDDKGVNFDLD
ncbi:DUF3631 domain-containing protein [Entomomonas asaccharolytica]|uniref:DUF3631 domain-containing protein n=1 Tax=Entomomonas asaccharolytica TaxID=2785331 RepID=A0A974RX27_9GAMM|nr:DUF3631 domain-containing protein [Entomomonas asaccharolytica]QQP85745.1 DUF3631 domain-containing protein [Entomomonas asaccharolytica]